MGCSIGGARTLALAAACALGAPRAAAGQGARHLWVLRPPDALIEYDITTFTPRRTLSVPPFLAGAPESVDINAAGQVLFQPPRDEAGVTPEMASARMWLWDGTRARQGRVSTIVSLPGRAGRTALTATSEWWLSARGDSLYRFDSRFQATVDTLGIEQATRNAAGVWRTDLAASARGDSVATLAELPACRCATGACSETCPEWSFWAPQGGVSDVFLLTRWIPGQLGATYEETLAYRRSGGRWERSVLPEAMESPRAASTDGQLIVTARLDGGCCGWVNESSDRLLLVRGSVRTVVYDEFQRFGNPDYDISFLPTDVALAPGNRLLAYTLATDLVRDSGRIRLSDSGRPNPAELARVEQELAQMPAVDVVELRGGAPRRLVTVPRAALIGWLNEHELLLAQQGRLVVYDLRGGAIRPTGIPVRNERDAFLR